MKEQIEDLTLIQLLGKGSYGEVYLSKKQNSNQLFATKKVNKAIVDSEMQKYFENEIKILKELNHPNIVKFEEKNLIQIIIILLWNILMVENYLII